MTKNDGPAALEMCGGVECTVNRVRDACFTQLERSGQVERDCDLKVREVQAIAESLR